MSTCRCSRFIRRFSAEISGAIAIAFAVSLPAMVAVVAVAVDYLNLAHTKTKLQSAADAAALGGAREFSLSGTTDSQIKSVTRSYVMANLNSGAEASPAHPDVAIDVKVKRQAGEIEVGLRQEWTPILLHMFSTEVSMLEVKARAQYLNSGLTCVLGLSRLLPGGINLWKNASLNGDGCSVISNNQTPAGLTVNDNAELKAKFICVAGGYVSVNARAVEPAPTTDCPAVQDPLASRSPPPIPPCKELLPLVLLNHEQELEPGRYCGGIVILGNSRIKLKPGIYIIDNVLKVSGTASLEGNSVGFYMKGLAATFQFDSGTTIDLAAPKDGPMAGLLFFEDRNAPPLRQHIINSNNARRLVGTFYLPAGTLYVGANAPVADNSEYTAFVVHSLQLEEGPKVVLRSDYEMTDVPVPPGLIGQRVFLKE
jgi:hypothetical protein